MRLTTRSARILSLLLCAVAIGGLASGGAVQDTEASVNLDLFGAYENPDGPGAQLRWRTLNELGTWGFNIYRSELPGSHGTLVNTEGLIPGCGCATGGEYEYIDEAAQPGVPYYYWLASVTPGGFEDAFYETTANCGCDRPLILPGGATAQPTATWTPPAPTDTPQPTDTVPAGQPTSTPVPTNTRTPTPAATAGGTAPGGTSTSPAATVKPPTPTLPAGTTRPPATPTSQVLATSVVATRGPTQLPQGTAIVPATNPPVPGGNATATAPVIGQVAITGTPQPVATAAPGSGRPTAVAQAVSTRAGARATRVGPGGGNSGSGLLGPGMVLIGGAVIGLAVLGGIAWRMLRAPSRPGGPQV